MINLHPRVTGDKPGRERYAPRAWEVRIPASSADLAALSGKRLVLVLALEGCARARSFCWPSNPMLAARIGASVGHVSRLLGELEQLGWIRRVHDTRERIRVRRGILLMRRIGRGPVVQPDQIAEAREALERARAPIHKPADPPMRASAPRDETGEGEKKPPEPPPVRPSAPATEVDTNPPPTPESWSAWWKDRAEAIRISQAATGQGDAVDLPPSPRRRSTGQQRPPWWASIDEATLMADPILRAAVPGSEWWARMQSSA